MKKLTDSTSFEYAQSEFAIARLWQLMDGNKESLNIAHEAVDRHASSDNTAINIAHSDCSDEKISFKELSRRSSQVANWLLSLNSCTETIGTK